MKRLFVYIFIGFLCSCNLFNKDTCKMGPSERHFDFLTDIKRQANLDYLEAIVNFRQFGSNSKDLWIRKPENLKLVYGSLQKIGLEKFISGQEFNKPLFTEHWAETCWENQSLNQIVKNLVLSYSDTTGFDKYYIEFWDRRKEDENEYVVLQILSDIDKTYNFDPSPAKLNWESEPTIVGLFEFEIKLKKSDSSNLKKTKIEYFKYLKNIGLNSSANNLIHYENELVFNELEKWDNDYLELINQIETDSVNCEDYWNWRHSAEWFTDINYYGP